MEKRAVLAFVLSMLVLGLYLWVQERYFTPPVAPPEEAVREMPAAEHPSSVAGRSGPAVETPPPPPPVVAARPADDSPRPRPPQTTATVETPLYHAVVSSEGGKLQEWTLHYRGEKAMVLIAEHAPGGLVVAPPGARTAEPVAMTVTPGQLHLGRERPSGELRMAGDDAGVRVQQTLRFTADEYQVRVHVRLENVGTTARTVSVMLPWNALQQWDPATEKFGGQHPNEVVWSSGGRVDRLEGLPHVPEREIEGEWVGIGSIWYLAAFVPQTPGFKIVMQPNGTPAAGGKTDAAAGRVMVGVRATPTIGPGRTWEADVLMYVGPKEYERLSAIGLERAINFGGFPVPRSWGGLPMEWFGVPILLLMKWLYGYVGNYGIAIILLTVITKLLFYPLTVKSIRSMKAMQALQPQVNALRTKYKSDPQRAQREMMDLYRKHRVNPMGGCLPMLAQVPIFYALYLALSVSVELQNAGFICFGRIFGVDLWICDLASHDPTYILPILMGVTMFVQQKMMPTTADPRQAKMMLFMPFVFTFMFLTLPSGLVLYWTVSNVLQILQQWYMERAGIGVAGAEMKNVSRA